MKLKIWEVDEQEEPEDWNAEISFFDDDACGSWRIESKVKAFAEKRYHGGDQPQEQNIAVLTDRGKRHLFTVDAEPSVEFHVHEEKCGA